MSIQAMKGETNLAYETKVLLIAIAKIIKKSNDIEEIYNTVAEMANAEGVILEPFEKEK